ncbi:MAG: Ig-like domain-containing protein [Tannerella sp.]|nr:Ig-like domain-containing protein [Tannerella sp.]
MARTHYEKYIRGVFLLFCGMMMMTLFLSCIYESVEPEIEIATIEMHTGYSIQLTVPSKNVEWVSDNPSVARVSATGLVTAIGKGTATIYTYSSKGKQNIVCYLEIYPKRNILFYIGGDSNLSGEVDQKISQIRQGWTPDKGEMIIYADKKNVGAYLFRVNGRKDVEGYYGLDTLRNYGQENSANPKMLERVINTMVSDYPADSYGMLFFSHASGWLPAGTLNNPRSLVIDDGESVRHEMEYDDFAAAIPDKRFDFIILEACLMADVMSMYELRNKAGYVLASSAEIVSPGFGGSNGLITEIYKKEIMRLYDTKNGIKSVVSGFAQSYYDYIATIPENDVYCSTTLSLIKTDEMEALAYATKMALQGKAVDETTLDAEAVQRFDRPGKLIKNGYGNSRYFDFAHTVEQIAPESYYRAFNVQLDKTVVWKAATKRFLLGNRETMPDFNEYDGFFIERHSGLTTYIMQDAYPYLNSIFKSSSWYKAISGE